MNKSNLKKRGKLCEEELDLGLLTVLYAYILFVFLNLIKAFNYAINFFSN